MDASSAVEPTSATERDWPKRNAYVALALVIALAAWAHRGMLALGFTGTDALADVAAARVDDAGDALGQLWSPLTGGIAGSNANFWRPITMVHYATLRALFGWDALGYHVVGFALYAAAALLAYALVRAAGRPRREGVVAAALAALHPLGVESAPVVARHIDLLYTLLGVAMLLAVTRERIALATVLGALAIGAKEVAVVLLPVAVLWAYVRGDRRGARSLAVAFAIVVPLFLVGRHLVLDGWGGYRSDDDTFFLDRLDFVRATFRAAPLELLFPNWSGAIERRVPLELAFPLGATLVGVAAALAVVAYRRGTRTPLLGLAIVLAPLVLYAATAMYSRRLVHVVVIGAAIGLSALASHRALRWLLVLWVLTLLPRSTLFAPDESWAHNDAITRAMTEELAERYAALPEGARVWVYDLPLRLNDDPRRTMLWRGGRSLNNTFGTYSLRAWLDDRVGRPDVELVFLNHSDPQGPLDAPRVTVEGDALRVSRGPLDRGWSPKGEDAFEKREDGSDVVLRRRTAAPNEWMLVAGGERAALVEVPSPAPR